MMRKILPDSDVRERLIKAEDIYLKNRLKITEEEIASIFPLLEKKINNESSSLAEFDSFSLFLRICFKYQDKLPGSFKEFKDPDFLKEKFINLKQAKLFNKQTTKHEKTFIENALKKLSSMNELGKNRIEKIEVHKVKTDESKQNKLFPSTGKNLLTVFSETLSKTNLPPIEKSGENHTKSVEKAKEKSPSLLSSQSTVFGKKRKHNEVETAEKSLEKFSQSTRASNKRLTTIT